MQALLWRNVRNGGNINLEPVQVNDFTVYRGKVPKQMKFPPSQPSGHMNFTTINLNLNKPKMFSSFVYFGVPIWSSQTNAIELCSGRKDRQTSLKLRKKKYACRIFCAYATKNTDGRGNLCGVKLVSNLSACLPPHSWILCLYYHRKQHHFSANFDCFYALLLFLTLNRLSLLSLLKQRPVTFVFQF